MSKKTIIFNGREMTKKQIRREVEDAVRSELADVRHDQQAEFDELIEEVAAGRVRDPETIDKRLNGCGKSRDQLRLALEQFNGRGNPGHSDPPVRLPAGISAR